MSNTPPAVRLEALSQGNREEIVPWEAAFAPTELSQTEEEVEVVRKH